LLATQLDASSVLGLVSFDCHPGSPFFSHRRRTLLLLVYVFSFRHHSLSLSPQKATPVLTTTLALSLLRRSLARSVCSDVHICLSRSPPLVARALWIVLNFSPQKASATTGRPAACATAKGASERGLRRPSRCRRGRDVVFDPPPRGRACLVESPCQGGN
jgi:hypothetical protein